MIFPLVLAAVLELSFGHGDLVAPEWREVSYRGHTRYVLEGGAADRWLHAEADGRHSALFRRVNLDLRRATLRWRWRVLRHPAGANTRIRSRDDRGAAVFVMVRRSLLPWRTRGLLYQWAEGDTGGVWFSSPYARDVKVITLVNAAAGEAWRVEERDLGADLRAAFGIAPERVEAIGVLCDADNTGDRAVADFGGVRLSWWEGESPEDEAPSRGGR